VTVLVDSPWRVGDRIGPLECGPVTRTTIALFAGGSGDHNDIHLDVDVARAAGLDDVFAQGMLSMAYLGRLLTDTFGPDALLSFSTRFTAITPVGARPVCSGEITSIEGNVATLEVRAEIEAATATLVGTARVRLAAD
jgi:acyl dehydratase